MSIASLGSPTANLYSKTANTKSSNQTSSANATASEAAADSSVVNLSNSGKQAITDELSFKDIGSLAREKLDVLRKQAAEKNKGSANTVDIQKVDYSSFSDQELAAMAKNSSKNFTEEEQIHAEGWLNERVRVALEPYRAATNAGDRRGHAMAINVLYEKMSPEVRSALGWTPTMMAANNQMLDGDEKRYGKLESASIFHWLQSAAVNGGLSLGGEQIAPE